MKNWNDKTNAEKVLIIMRIIISIIVLIASIVQLLGIYNKAINLAVPLLGLLLLVQSIQEWKASRGVAILGFCSAIFIFICSFVVFFMS